MVLITLHASCASVLTSDDELEQVSKIRAATLRKLLQLVFIIAEKLRILIIISYENIILNMIA